MTKTLLRNFAFFTLIGPICLIFAIYVYGMARFDAVIEFVVKYMGPIGIFLVLGSLIGIVFWIYRNTWTKGE